MEYGLVALWLAMYLAVGALALPLAAAAFGRFPYSGAGFAVPVGLTVLTLVAYLFGHVAFGAPALVAGAVVLAAASVRVGDPEAIEPRRCGEIAVVFSVSFLLLVSLRASSPAIAPLPIAAGEKFLDYGLLRSLLRAPSLPPEDMWFAGEPVRYYYGGQLRAALLTLLTGTAPRYAYNLALSGAYASLVAAAYGLAGAIGVEYGSPSRRAAALGAFFVGLAANLWTATRVTAWIVPDSLLASVPGIGDPPTWTPGSFHYWDASRVIEGTVNEFPLFAWLNGDLHAHMLNAPYTLLVCGLCYAYWLTPAGETTRRRALLLAAAPVAGLLAITNTWDFPIAGGVVALTVAFAPAAPGPLLPRRLDNRLPDGGGVAGELGRDGVGLLCAAAVLLVGGATVAPFWFGTASSRSVGAFPPRSDMASLLIVHGGFLLIFVPYLAVRATDRLRRLPAPSAAVAAAVGVAATAAWALDAAAVALFGPLLAAAWALLREESVGFETVLIAAGAGLVLLVEFLYVVEPTQGGAPRLNTVFKTYFGVWVIWAPAAGAVAAGLLGRSLPRPELASGRWRTVGTLAAVVAVVATGLYPVFAVPAHLSESPDGAEGATLDGEAYLASAYPGEAAAIEWLDDRDGRPTIVTAAPGGYRWAPDEGEGAAAPASLTGIPTVLGWHHEEQYRGTEPYDRRLRAVTDIYEGSTGRQSALFDRYDVEYVYVGPAERTRYDVTVDAHPRASVAFEEGDTVIYEVE